MAERFAGERVAAAPATVQVAGRAVLLVPHREGGVDEAVLPPECQRILAAVRQAGAPVATRPSARRWAWRAGCGASWSRCRGS